MKKFSKIEEINENKLFDKYLEISNELSDLIFNFISNKFSIKFEVDNMDEYKLHDLITESSEEIINVSMDVSGINESLEYILERRYTNKERIDFAKKGWAMPKKNDKGEVVGGSFPIKDKIDLKNAIRSYGLSKDKEEAKKFISNRAKDLKLIDELPKTWGVKKI